MMNVSTERVRDYLDRSSNISAALLGPEDHVSRGLAHFSLENYQAAHDEFAIAVAQRPMYVPAQFNLAVALLRLHRFEEAEIPLRTAIGLAQVQDVLLPDAPYYLAAVLRAQGRVEEALHEAKVATERGHDPGYLYLRAQLHALLSQNAEAIEWLRRAIASRPAYVDQARSDEAFDGIRASQELRDLFLDRSA